MNNSLLTTILNLASPVIFLGFVVPATALQTLPNLDPSFQIENSIKKFKYRKASVYAKAGVALSRAEDMQERIDTILQVRHTPERTVSATEYGTFVCHAVQASAQATMREIITILDTIAASIAYWQQQQGHQIRYLLHKNPVKLVTGKKQQAEIREHLDALYALQKTYFSHLGTIAQQVQAIAGVCATVSDQGSLIQRIVHAMGSVVGVSSTSSGIDADSIVDDTVKALYQMPLYLKRAQRELTPHLIPSWAARNWLPVGAAVVGSALSMHYYLNAKQNAHNWIDAKQDAIKPVVGTVCANIIGLANQVDDQLGVGTQMVDEMRIKTKEWANAVQDGTQKIHASLAHAGVQVVGTVDDIHQKVQEANASTVSQVMSWVPGKQMPAGMIKGGIASAVDPYHDTIVDKIAKGIQYSTCTKATIQGNVETFQKYRSKYAQKITNAIQIVQGKIGLFNEKIIESLPSIMDGVDATGRVSKNIITFGLPIAALAIAYCSYKLTKSVYETIYPLLFPELDYYYVRQSLRDISRLFNSYQQVSTLSIEHLGALAYHVHTLQYADVPGELKDQFTADVTELASEQYTLEQKMRTIERMYRSYDFLAVSC